MAETIPALQRLADEAVGGKYVEIEKLEDYLVERDLRDVSNWFTEEGDLERIRARGRWQYGRTFYYYMDELARRFVSDTASTCSSSQG